MHVCIAVSLLLLQTHTSSNNTKNPPLKHSVINEAVDLYSNTCSLSHHGLVINGPVAGPQTTLWVVLAYL